MDIVDAGDGRHALLPALNARHESDRAPVFLVVFSLAVLITIVLTVVGLNAGVSAMVVCVTVPLLLALVAWRPVSALYIVCACAVIIEEGPLTFSDFTDRLDVFHWPAQLEGLPERPIGFFFYFCLFIVACHRIATRRKVLELGPLILPFLLFLLSVAIGVLHGLATGGDFRIIVVEIRPFIYLFLGYLLAYTLVSRREHVRTFFWIVIVGAGVKTLQGLFIIVVDLHGHLSNQNEIMAHEESFFWVSLLLLSVVFSLHHRYRPQLFAALALAPFVAIDLLANNRRADYVALVVGVAFAWCLIAVVSPGGPHKHIIAMLLCGALGTGYVAVFSHVPGSLGKPANAILSVIHPSATDTRDLASNLYRQIEDFDLKFTAKQSPIIGYGFGKPFLQPELLPNVIASDPYYNYVPHNNIYWIWMRLGALGYFALWYLLGAIIIRACMIARTLRDAYLQVVAIYVVGVTVMEVLVAYADYQLFFYRNVIFLGLIVGMLLRLPALDKQKEAPADAPVDAIAARAPALVGR